MYLLVFMLVLLLLLQLRLPLLFLPLNCACTPCAKTCPVAPEITRYLLPELPRFQGVRNLEPCHVEPQIGLRKIRNLKRSVTGTTDVLVHAVCYQN